MGRWRSRSPKTPSGSRLCLSDQGRRVDARLESRVGGPDAQKAASPFLSDSASENSSLAAVVRYPRFAVRAAGWALLRA
eukprot:15461925-Alexandrium_andersonii.AAC.1